MAGSARSVQCWLAAILTGEGKFAEVVKWNPRRDIGRPDLIPLFSNPARTRSSTG
jgi:hypothetical protein